MSWWRKFRHGDANRDAAQAAIDAAEKSVQQAHARHWEVQAVVQYNERELLRNHFQERLNMARRAHGH